MQTLEIAFFPSEALVIDADCYVVVDALRATTTIATLFGRGLRDLVATESLELARELAQRDERLLFGEVEGVAPAGFDYGNSPVEASTAAVEGKGAVLYTSNGTRALCSLAAKGAAVLAGSLANASAIVKALAAADTVVLVCAGNSTGRRFALEDFLAAGTIASIALEANPELTLGDAARLGVAAAASAELPEGFLETQHGQVTVSRGFTADVEYAAKLDSSSAVPVAVEYGKGWTRLTLL